MTQNINILQELNELESTLANVAPQNVYSVPTGYFEGLANEVLNKIKASEATNAVDELAHLSPVLSSLSKEMPYTIPAGYFDGLEERMLAAVKDNNQTAKEELETLSPLLSGLKKEMPFGVPQGYFENLATGINKTAEIKPAAKVVSITHRSWFKYAAAAVVVGVISVTAFLVVKKNNSPEKAIAKFEKKLDKEIKKTSDKELNDFLEYTVTSQDVAFHEPKEDVKELLKDVSASELKQFLDETADPEITADEKSSME